MANFSFSFISKNGVPKELAMLNTLKAIQESDLPGKSIAERVIFLAEVICKYVNDSLDKVKFSN